MSGKVTPMANEATEAPAVIVKGPGHRMLKVFGVTVQGTTKEHLWPAMEQLAEAINIAAERNAHAE